MNNKTAARILVKSGYADYATDNGNYVCWRVPEIDDTMEAVQYMSDTLEGRKQLDVIEDYLWFNENRLYANSYHKIDEPIDETVSHHQWRKDRIEWVLSQLPENADVN